MTICFDHFAPSIFGTNYKNTHNPLTQHVKRGNIPSSRIYLIFAARYVGVGWYRKTVDLSNLRLDREKLSASGSSLWLWIGGAPGGVMRSATV